MNLLSGQALCFSCDAQSILDDVDITLAGGEMLGLIGPNGAGKSTLLRLLAGVITADKGVLSLEGKPISTVTPRERARRIAYLPQLSEIAWPMSVERLVALGRIPHLEPWQHPGPYDTEIIERVIAETDLLPYRDRPFNTLSGGEQARVVLARAMVSEPDILLADEPVSALDPAHQLDVMTLLSKHCEAGHSVIVVLHDLNLAAHFCKKLKLLYQGRTLAEGDTNQVLTPQNLEKAYAIEMNPSADRSPTRFHLPWRRISK
ncbi:MAG: ABC transporter ATP-binding protein [Candidatus Thiodiazotropha sp. (ex Rostrolucina anterorostrata)]|nr:ABC transporter ATP-binding protein [Candidatus Thiodiazotropha sp. (ex Rostrolucina anterorostrata)]